MPHAPEVQQHEPPLPRRSRLWFKVCLGGGAILLVALVSQIPRWREETILRYRKERQDSQIAKVKAGETNCIYYPDPKFLDDLVQDAECAERLTKIQVGEQFPPSNPENRFAAMKKLPHLKTIYVCYTAGADAFLNDIQGMTSLEEISFDKAEVSVAGARHLTSFPNLKKIYFVGGVDPAVIEVLKERPNIETVQVRSAR